MTSHENNLLVMLTNISRVTEICNIMWDSEIYIKDNSS